MTDDDRRRPPPPARGGSRAVGRPPRARASAEALVTARRIRELRETTGQHGEQVAAIAAQLRRGRRAAHADQSRDTPTSPPRCRRISPPG